MLHATVTGRVWSSRRLEGIPAGAFLELAVEGGSSIVAFDVLGVGLGERVLVATGSVAASWFPGRALPPIDALVIGSIDPDVTAAAAPPRQQALEDGA